MKFLFHISALSLFTLLFSCKDDPSASSDKNETVPHAHLEDTTSSEPAQAASPAFNSKDRHGRRQGKWMTKHSNGLPGYEHWRNDTLHGYFKFWYNDSTKLFEEGWYKNGKLDSLLLIYEGGKLKGVTSFRNGSWSWIGFPGDAEYILPQKSFGTNGDSVYVNCPHANRKPWYRGLFVKKEPRGIHYSYREDGSMRYKYDYGSRQVFYYDKSGQLIDTMSMEMCSGALAGQ